MKKYILFILLFFYANSFASDFSVKIIGGDEITNDNKYPWMVGLLHKNIQDNKYAQFCGGTYIGNGWVITAAHCFYDPDNNEQYLFPDGLDILYGTSDLTSGGQRIGVEKIYIHENYSHTKHFNDIALIKLNQNISIPKISILDNSKYSYALPDMYAILMGWGDTDASEDTSYPDKLMEISLPIVSNSKCNFVYPGMIKSINICAGYEDGGKDSCQGDSGGPLVVTDDNNNYLIAGIVSWAYGCAEPLFYGVNTRVSQYEDWITHIMNSTYTTQYNSIIMPDDDTLSLSVENGKYNEQSPYKLESCYENINGQNTSMLKITQEFTTSENQTEISIIFPEKNETDEFYIKDTDGEYIFANDFISIAAHKAAYSVIDNGNFDLNNEVGKIKTIIVKTNTYFNELKPENDESCFDHSIEDNNSSGSSSGGSGCSTGNAGITSWIIILCVLGLKKLFKQSFFKSQV